MPDDQPPGDAGTARVAERVLGILAALLPPGDAVTLESGLREHGLDSLASTRVWFQLRKELGVDIPVRWLGGCRTAAELVARVREEVDTAAGQPPRAAPLPADHAGRYEPFPLTDIQQAYLIGKDPDLGEDAIGCHVYRELMVDGLDTGRLGAAWRRVVEAHDMLRTVLTPDGRQRVRETVPVPPVAVHDLTGCTEAEAAREVAAVRDRLAHRRYESGEWPMFTVEACQGPSGRGVVHLSIDAMLTDGHGLAVLLDDWWRCYRDPDHQVPRPELTVRDCVLALAGREHEPGHRRHLDYWAERLAGLPPGPDPAALGRVAAAGGWRRTALSWSLDREQWRVLRQVAAGWEVSPAALMLTLFAEAFGRHRVPGPFSVVLTANHRPRLPGAAEAVVGPFTSTVVMRLPQTLDVPLRAAAQAVHHELWQDLDHAEVSGVAALRAARGRARGAAAPALPVVFTSLLGTGPPEVPGGFAGAVTSALSQTTGVALDHQMWERDGELHLRWDVAAGRFPPGAPQSVFAAFVNSLYELTAQPPQTRPMNELQQAYFVPRALGERAPWDGCQVYHSFAVDDLDLRRLESAWLRLVERHDVLRTVVTPDGRLSVSPVAPRRRCIPVVCLDGVGEPAAYLDELRERMVGWAFPLGRGPHCDLRVTVDPGGAATVHVTIDLTIVDGRSIHFLLRELFRLYADPAAEPVCPATYAEYLAERTGLEHRPEYPLWTAHWRERVAALPPGPLLPPPSSQPPQAGRARVRWAGRLTGWRAVRERAERDGLAPDDLLLAAFTEALAGHCPVPFSVPVVRWTQDSQRYRPGEYTALSWVVRGDAGLPVREQAAAFRRYLADDLRADAVDGLGALRRRVMKERRTGDFQLPVVYTGLLDLRRQPLPPGVRLGPWLTCTPDVALDCIAIDEGDELLFYWDAVPARFPDGQLDAMFGRYRELLGGLAGDGPVTLSEAQRRTILYDWNDTGRGFPADRPVHLLFEEQVRARPDAVAVCWAGGTMTYAELNRRANRVAWALRRAGVGPRVPVGVSVPRGPHMVAAVFGVLKAGGCYVPLEPSLPAARAATILASAAVPVVVTSAGRRGWPVPGGVREVAAEPAAEPDGDPDWRGAVSDTAYVIFTSGSTGTPKGVAVAHRPLLNLLSWCQRTHGFGPGDMGLCVTSLGFDLSVFDILGLLSYGARLYVADETEQKDPQLLLDILLREPVTFWNSAPATLNQLAPLFPARAGAPGAETLRLVYLSGDYTPLPLPGEIRSLFRNAHVVSLGGATEATVWSNWFDVDRIDPAWRSIPYGRPIDNARYYVLDESMQPCPVGVEGDLYIGGDCLSQGYYRRPDLTAQRFVPDPYGGSGGRLYRTGDRATYFPDGTICFLGRADGQVKIRGFRVELAEVAHRLRAHPGVKDLVVLARPAGPGDRKLVAYVVPTGPTAPRVADLRRHAAAALPDYMVPNVVAFVDTFPATANGKLDSDALPWPVPAGSSHVLAAPAGRRTDDLPDAEPPPAATVDRADAAPPPSTVDASRLAVEIAEIFAELLGVAAVDPDEDVWDQGATSFTMVQVSGALQQRHGRRVPVSVLLAEPTVAGIAGAVAAQASPPPAADQPAADQPAAPPPAPPSPPAAARPGPVDFFAAEERDAFKRAGWNLRRRRPDDLVVALDDVAVAEQYLAWRASRREFDGRPVPHRDFSRLLGLLRETEVDGRRRRLYPSAGDTYAVQVYLHVRPGGVEGVPEGLYYYHPVDHALQLVRADPGLDRSVHFVYNRPVFDHAGFELYLFGQADAIEPLYGADSERFLLLEAGYLGQLLLLGQTSCGVGLCPVGTVALGPVVAGFGLDDRHRYLHAFLGGRGTPLPPVAASGERPLFVPGPGPVPGDEVEVAVVGVAGRYPGADDLDAFWRNVSRGTPALVEVPASRWGQLAPRPGQQGPVPLGGYLEDVDTFDSLLFHVPPAEAAELDPQLRLLLHTVWECLEQAGHTAGSLSRTGRVGLFLGAMWQDHRNVGVDRARRGGPATISATASEAANRISHFFGLTGPSLAVDTSCSSSLAALHLAVGSLRRGECESAVVAAANLLTHPYHLRLLTELGLVAERAGDGAFDAAAPGWAPGEGVGALLLRVRAAAERDGDDTCAVIEATRIGHLGGSGRFATPNAAALRRSIAETLAAAGVGADEIGYVECAAAGATLSDAAEVEALGEVFAGRAAPVPVGTVKPNIGHLEAAAGLSQLTKVLLQMRHRQIAPTLLAAQPSPLVSWDRGGLRPADRLTFWTAEGAPRRALVNAVGATGSYGHVIMRAVEAGGSRTAVDGPGPVVVPLSAQTGGQLAQLADRLVRHLVAAGRGGGGWPVLADVGYTLQTGRVALAHRLVVTAVDVDELVAALRAFVAGSAHPSLATGVAAADAGGDDAGTAIEAAAGWLRGREVDWARFWPAGQARRVALPTYPFAAERYRAEAGPPVGVAAPPTQASRPDGGDRRTRAEDYLRQVYADVSGIPVERLDIRTPMEHYGLSSVLVAQLNARLAAEIGAAVPSTLFFAHRDLAAVAEQIAPLLPAAGGPAGPRPEPGPAREAAGTGPVAIVGIAGRYPQAPDLDQFWHNLLDGRDAIGELPAGRRQPGWPCDLMVGGFLDDVAAFDPLFFGITPRDAAAMDPQERLFLQVAWHALEDAGYPRTRLRTRHHGRAGVFVGCMYNEYPFFGLARAGHDRAGARSTTGSAIAGIANRVSYFLDLNGPSMTVDTMCSSSLTAIHLAVLSLRRGECEVALAGGVNLSLHPNKFHTLRELKMAATDHRCRSFGAGGDGFVPGEGVGAVLLKPLEQAVADGDRVHAVILGTAVNHDGRTNGYTVPSPVAQGALISQALRDAGVAPADIGYLEAHGTGTALGDPIELDGLDRAFAGEGLAPGGCAIGSVKSNIGHLEAAAGIAGLTKVVLQMRHGTLAPSLHADRLNPHVDWSRSPFRVQRTAGPWRAGRRQAGISSFGAGGANAHVVVADHGPAAPPSPAAGPHLVLLSARTDEQLRELAGRWAAALAERAAAGEPVPLADLAYTSQTGREALKERLAVVVDDHAELAALLRRFVAGGTGDELVRGRSDGSAGPAHTGPTGPVDRALLARLGRQWAAGGTVDWSRLPGSGRRRIIDLPGYPFARVRCWADEPEPAGRPAAGADEPAPPAVPLLVRGWRAEPPAAVTEPAGGVVVCLLRDGHRPVADAFADALRADRLLVLREGIDYRDPAEAAGVVGVLLDRHGPVTGLLDLCALPEPGTAGATSRDERDDGPWLARLAVLQRVLLSSRPPGGVRLVQVTSGLLDLPGPPPDLAGARLAGFVRSLAAEYRSVRASVVDVDRPAQPGALGRELAGVWRAPGPYGEVCLRDGVRHRPCLLPAPPDEQPAWRPDPDRVYLVAGGTRGLGALAARHLVTLGARRLALLGVRALPPRHEWPAGPVAGAAARTVAHIQELERLGARVMVHTGPLTDRAALDRFLAGVRVSLGEVGAVVHCAGAPTTGPAPLVHKDPADIRRVLEPKTDGLDALVELTRDDPLDAFVLFSSVSAAVGPLAAGVSDYAAANAYLDYLAGVQARSGRSCFRSVNWPVWRETGGGADRPDAAAGVGLDSLTDAAGLAVLRRVLARPPAPVVLPCPALPGGFDPETALRVNRPAPDAVGGAQPMAVPVEPGAMPPAWLVELFAGTVGIPARQLETDTPFGELGVESVLLAELLTRIEAAVGRPLEPAVLLDHPTLRRLAGYLARPAPSPPPPASAPPSPSAPPPPSAPPSPPASVPPAPAAAAGADVRPAAGATDCRIAVIGMACRLPGAPDLAAFWRLLRAAGCAVTEVPAQRWDVARLYRPEPEPGRSVSKWGGFVTGLEEFDPSFFGISDGEARDLDPAVRMMLEGTAACLRDAGYRDDELRGADVGVFAGARMSGYRRRIGVGGAAGLGGDQNFIAARVAHQYDLHGPSLVVDSACSSALVAVQLAIRSLLAGESSVALAGATEVLLDEEPYLEFSHARALSPRGRCAAFAHDADGFVPGEGCGVLLLKPLHRALRDGDRVRAVIEAVAVGNDGHTMGLTTPNPAAQAQVVRRALELSGRTADQIGMIEAHGTGTMIGDPIELRGLTDVFREHTDRTGFCAIGSVKSNIGHLLSAAGMAGLIKALLALEHGQLPATLFCGTPNPRFDFASSPFLPNTGLRDWPAGPRVAGVSAFGLGGTNAHLVACAAPGGQRPRRAPLPVPVFARRRLWWDRVPEPAPATTAQPAAAPGNGHHRRPLVASVLHLDFAPAPPTAEDDR